LPLITVNWALRRYAELAVNKTRVSTTVILAGLVGFGTCYGAYIAVFFALFGWPATLWYALLLPVTGLVAHYYLRGLRHFLVSLRSTVILLRAPVAARRLQAQRQQLIAEIDAARWEVPPEAL
jgi:hypothetical protein